ncbi:MAG: sigma-70 family RNA polymerase sigma factor [Verrucomicrobiae bacterium]|nr:sigma-70 family RNA polymerase sigma factor [Verrucomicrobiae bacterium]
MMPSPETSAAGRFVTTRWSVVARAGGDDSRASDVALAELCGAYWYPLYAYARRRGHAPEEAQDLTQAFFARLLEKNYVADARQEKGKFRAFLLVAMKRFMADEWGRQHAQKRGGFRAIVSIDQGSAESRLAAEMSHDQSPDLLFDRQWALTLLERVRSRLRDEYVASGRAALFEHLEGWLAREEEASPHAEIAARLGLTVPAVKMAVRRLRGRYRELLREEIGQTVAAPEDIDGEIRHLFSIFGP